VVFQRRIPALDGKLCRCDNFLLAVIVGAREDFDGVLVNAEDNPGFTECSHNLLRG
jgi:hypothetical protein